MLRSIKLKGAFKLMTTKIKAVIIAVVCAIATMNVITLLSQYQNRNRMHVFNNQEKDVAAPSLKGKYKIQDKQDDCPVCLETTYVVKPFKCNHSICEDCLNKWATRRAQNRVYDENYIPVRCKANCPTCRAELREPDRQPQ